MGVDIAFHFEVRHEGKWHAFRWQTPTALEHYPEGEDKGKQWKDNLCCYCCRHYHFQDMINDSPGAITGLPEDCSEEIRHELEEYHQTGYLPFEDVIHFCDKAEEDMLFNLLKSKECSIAKAVHRIEKAVRQKAIPKSLEPDDGCRSDMTIKEIYEEYQDEVGCCIRLRDTVWALTEDYYYLSASDIRLIYCIG